MDNLADQVERLESQSRRENLIFHGFEDKTGESWDETETLVRRHISNELNLNEGNIAIERAHRLNTRSTPRPVIVKFSSFKDKDQVIRTYREQRKVATAEAEASNGNGEEEQIVNERKGVRISEDFTARVRQARAALKPFLREHLKEKRQAYIRFDKLVVDGVVFSYNEDEKVLVRA
ncbi:MAG: hypothetical protein ABW185_21075 [Sedimenticola sp.]